MGERVAGFEENFAAHFGSKYAVMVNSGSSANLLAVAALSHHSEMALKPGDEVIVPAVSWSTTYYPFHQYGLRLKFVDVELPSMTIDPELVSAAITERTRAICAVNLLGGAADYESLENLCRQHDLILIEDNCEAMGAKYGGKRTGTFGEFGTHSMFFSHHINTMEGGMILIEDEELQQLCVSLRSHGWTRGLPTPNRLVEKSNDPFEESFRFILPGYNLRPLELSAAVGQIQLDKLDTFVKMRRANAEVFRELFSDRESVIIQQPHGESSWFGFAVVLAGSLRGKRKEVVADLTRANIECRPIVAGNFVRNPVMKYLNYDVHGELPNSDRIHDDGLFVGNHHFDISDDLERFANILLRQVL